MLEPQPRPPLTRCRPGVVVVVVVALLVALGLVVPAGGLADRALPRTPAPPTTARSPSSDRVTPAYHQASEAGTSVRRAVAAAPTTDGRGFWVLWANGSVTTSGTAIWYGDMAGRTTNGAMAGIAPSSDGNGYWLLGSDGGVFSFGDAVFAGSTGATHLNAPALEMATSAGVASYYFVAGDGGVFSFGGAPFFGSTGNLRLNRPVVGMASTQGAGGYWLIAADGGIFAFGDAGFHGSTGGVRLNAPIVGLAPTATGHGYWTVGADGGVFTFGDAAFHGSAVGQTAGALAIGLIATTATGVSGGGYWIVLSSGVVLSYGDAPAVAGPLPSIPPPATANQGLPGQYSFEVADAAGDPIRWNPCEVVHYSVVDADAPAGWGPDVAAAFGQLAVATGMGFVMDGVYTSPAQVPPSTKLTISWATALTGGDYVGLTTYYYILSSPWTPQVTGAKVQLLSKLPSGGGTNGELPVLLHELGHAVGLGHTVGPEVMNSVDQGYSAYQAGDSNGLTKVGAAAGCAGFYS